MHGDLPLLTETMQYLSHHSSHLLLQLHSLKMIPQLCLFFFFLPAFAVAQIPLQNHINQTDVHQAMVDMRSRSFHGFVILLKLLNTLPNSIPTTGITFLMPSNQHLAEASINPENLRDFLGIHSFPMALTMRDILHFPDGSLIPSGAPSRMLSITNGARSGSGIFVNNARIMTPNVCISAFIRCHGISAPISVNGTSNLPPTGLRLQTTMLLRRHAKMHHRVSSPAHGQSKRRPIIH